MNNSEKYHFADFTRANYRRLLKMAKQSYKFKLFTEEIGVEPTVYWRHDVDYSPQSALKLAQIEMEEGVKSTFFLLLHSEFYNLLERKNFDCFQKIISIGHEVGIHFDSSFYGIKTVEDLNNKLKMESDFFRSIFNTNINVFSFHNPFQFELSCKDDFYAGLINSYATRFHNDIGYCSDSNGYWRYERLETILTEKKFHSLQILTHPEWWQDDVLSPRQRVMRCIDGRSQNLKQDYDEFLLLHKRENIDW